MSQPTLKLNSQPGLPFEAAMNTLATNILYADADFNLVYMNKRSTETLREINAEVQAILGFSYESFIGRSIDDFHKNPAYQRKMLSNEKNFPIRSEIKLGSLILDLNIERIANSKGDTEGYVVNWEEISEKKRVEADAQRAQSMIDLSPINIMMATPEGVMISMNKASEKSLLQIQEFLPANVDQLIGKQIDWFHKNPGNILKIIKDPRNLPHKAIISVGTEKLDLLVSAITDKAGNYMGPMVSWSIATVREKLIKELTEASNMLATASEELLAVSATMSASAEETSAQANTASVASEEINAGIQTVATNMEEMTASIKEITKNTNESSARSNEAMNLANNANSIIQALGESSQDIGNVIKVITSIAQQTNLLALNATIEAARAGEAGKGFAVVANEVKELAKQTATATEDISRKIEAIQGDSQTAVTSIGSITDSISSLNSIAGSIASAMEEQAATTNEVARVVTESSIGVQQISENIQQVSTAAEQTGKGTNDMQAAARNLSGLAAQLTSLVEQVKNI